MNSSPSHLGAAAKAFIQAAIYSDDVRYRLIHLPPTAITLGAVVLAEIGMPFSAMIADKDEITLLLPQDHWDVFAHRLLDYRVAGDFRLITFDLPLDHDLVGFMALVSRILTDANISLLALSAFERDHIFVPAAQFQAAYTALQTAQTRLSAS